MTTSKQKKSGNVSRSEPKQVNPQKVVNEDAPVIKDDMSINPVQCYESNNWILYVCIHGNNYWLCQQCEIRIRNQDIIDRIDYATKDSISEIVVTQASDGNFHLEPTFIPKLKEVLTEFPETYIHSDGSLCTGEGY